MKRLWPVHSNFFRSCIGLETQLLLALPVGYGNEDWGMDILNDIDVEQKMLIAFMDKLNN